MSTQAQIEANRHNAQLSTGPITESGKEAASQNAVKHGIFARIIPAQEAGFHELAESIKETYQPVGGLENAIVEQIAMAYFRLQRVYAYEHSAASLSENAYLDVAVIKKELEQHGIKIQAIENINALVDNVFLLTGYRRFIENPGAKLLIRYEAMLTRQIQRNLELLQKVQDSRRNREEFIRRNINVERDRAVEQKLGYDTYFDAKYHQRMTLEHLEALAARQESKREANRAQRRAAAKTARAAAKRTQDFTRTPALTG